jgi:hypothetical protein
MWKLTHQVCLSFEHCSRIQQGFLFLGAKKTAFLKKKTSLDCRFNTQTVDAHPKEKTTNTKDGNTPAPDLYEINHLGRFQPHLPCSHLPHTKFNTESTIFVDISAFKRLAPIRQSPSMGKPCHHHILQMHRTCSQQPLGNTLYLTWMTDWSLAIQYSQMKSTWHIYPFTGKCAFHPLTSWRSQSTDEYHQSTIRKTSPRTFDNCREIQDVAKNLRPYLDEIRIQGPGIAWWCP